MRLIFHHKIRFPTLLLGFKGMVIQKALVQCVVKPLIDTKNHVLGISSMNSMIIKFSEKGDIKYARKLFDQMAYRDSVSWNSMMSAYAQNNHHDKVLTLFSEMQRQSFELSQTSLTIVLSSCSKLRALDQGKQIHVIAMKKCYCENVYVGTSLITMYSKCKAFDCLILVFNAITGHNVASWNALISGFASNHKVDEARSVFDRMPRKNVISWTSLIHGYIQINQINNALELFNSMPMKNFIAWAVILQGLVQDKQYHRVVEFYCQMRSHGIISAPGVVSLMNACSALGRSKLSQTIHGSVIKLGLDADKIIQASLICLYFKCVSIAEARLVFDKLDKKFIEAWNSLICGYIDNDKVEDARYLFEKMDKRDQTSWNLIIKGYLRCDRFSDALEQFMKMPYPTLEAQTLIMLGYIKCGRIQDAERLFDEISEPDEVAKATMISGYVKEGYFHKAQELIDRIPANHVICNIVIGSLVQCGKIAEALQLFTKSPQRDVISWTYIISGCIKGGHQHKAFQLYGVMRLSNISPSESIISILLSVIPNISIQILGEQIHTSSIKFGLESCLLVSNSLLSMYGRCGDVLGAQSIFDQMPWHDLVTYNSMISSFSINGLVEKGIQMFERIKTVGLEPDEITFLEVLSACSHGGLTKEASYYFSSMIDHGVKPRLDHYACIIDLLCRKGMVEKAQEVVQIMPFNPDPPIWTSILSACQFNCNLEIAQTAAIELSLLNPTDSLSYLLLGRVFSSLEMLDDVGKLEKVKFILGLKKMQGCSWIEMHQKKQLQAFEQ